MSANCLPSHTAIEKKKKKEEEEEETEEVSSWHLFFFGFRQPPSNEQNELLGDFAALSRGLQVLTSVYDWSGSGQRPWTYWHPWIDHR